MRPRARLKTIPTAALCVGQALGASAQAADSTEFWPQASAYVQLTPGTRLYLDGSFASAKESDTRSLDLSAFLDISLKPILREHLLTEDWQRSRYFWARLGYTRVQKATDETHQPAEDRGIVSIYGKVPLPSEVWLEARARADLRWIDGEDSQRYRFRLEATREFTVLEHTVVPYLNAEWFYDTRYDGWARVLCMGGVEVTVDKHFRYEVYLGRQSDRQPSEQSLNALGVVAKWYY